MKGEILDISTCEDEFKNISYRVVIETYIKPQLILGKCEVKQSK